MIPGVAWAALILMLGKVVSRLLGVAREQVIAGLFGASASTDAFTAAARVPTALYDLLVGGMVSAALVPIFSDFAASKRERELWRTASSIFNLICLTMAVVLGILIPLAGPLIRVFASGFDADTQAQAAHLLRPMLPSLIFMGLAGVFTALHYSRQQFALPAISLAAYNGGIVVFALLLHGQIGITSLVVGVLAGSLGQVVLQVPRLRGLHYHLGFSLGDPAVRRIIALYAPVAAGLVVSTAGIVIDTNLASHTGEGSLAAMRFATTLVQFPLGLVAAATSFALLPTLSRHASGLAPSADSTVGGVEVPLSSVGAIADGGQEPEARAQALAGYKQTLALGIKMMLLVIVPATVGLIVLRLPVVQLLFQHGAFDRHAADRTALAFLAYSPGLPAAALDQLFIFAFYARRNTITPVTVGVIAVLVYIATAVPLRVPLGMPGLALANSAQWVSHAAIMFFLLWRAVGGLRGLGLGPTTLKILLSSAGMGLILLALGPALGWLHPEAGTMSIAAHLAAAGAIAVVVYVGLLGLLRVGAVGQAWGLVRARLPVK